MIGKVYYCMGDQQSNLTKYKSFPAKFDVGNFQIKHIGSFSKVKPATKSK